MKCNQEGCQGPAAFRFTWPGNDEAGICAEHASQLRKVAGVIGLHLQLIPLGPAESTPTRRNKPARKRS